MCVDRSLHGGACSGSILQVQKGNQPDGRPLTRNQLKPVAGAKKPHGRRLSTGCSRKQGPPEQPAIGVDQSNGRASNLQSIHKTLSHDSGVLVPEGLRMRWDSSAHGPEIGFTKW